MRNIVKILTVLVLVFSGVSAFDVDELKKDDVLIWTNEKPGFKALITITDVKPNLYIGIMSYEWDSCKMVDFIEIKKVGKVEITMRTLVSHNITRDVKDVGGGALHYYYKTPNDDYQQIPKFGKEFINYHLYLKK